MIGGRDKTKLVDGLARQAEAVQSSIDSTGLQVPAHACFCFINPEGQSGGTKLPLLRTLRIRGYPLLYPRKLAKRKLGLSPILARYVHAHHRCQLRA